MQYHENNLQVINDKCHFLLVRFIRIHTLIEGARLHRDLTLPRTRADATRHLHRDAKLFRDLPPHVRRKIISRRSIRRARYPSPRETTERISIDPEHGPILIMGATRRSTYPRVSRSHHSAIRT
jgi:hypothetical protein